MPSPAELTAFAGRDLVLGVRAEDVHDARAGSNPDAVTLPATVVDIQELGSHTEVGLEVATAAVSTPGAVGSESGERARLWSRFAPNAGVSVGQTVPIAVDVTVACVFDAVTGRGLRYPEFA